jgi:branched-subunit amino acid ABC-type transport system permease component
VLIAALPFTGANLEQLVADGLLAGMGYALVAVGFGLIINVTGRFHIAYGVVYALAAFVAGQVAISWGFPFPLALVVGVVASMLLAVVVERLLYWPLNRRLGAGALITIFIVSLGLATAGQNGIALLWIKSGTVNIPGFNVQGVQFLDVFTTNLALVAFLVGAAAILLVAAVIRWTKLGRMIRAVGANPELSLSVGIDPRLVYMSVFAIGTALGSIDAVFRATQSTATPDMGSTPILYAITIAFLARSSSPLVIAGFALLVGLVQSLSGFFVQPEWQQVVVFSGLLIYVLAIALRANMQALLSRRPPPAAAVTPTDAAE